jgi:hypothetical protein
MDYNIPYNAVAENGSAVSKPVKQVQERLNRNAGKFFKQKRRCNVKSNYKRYAEKTHPGHIRCYETLQSALPDVQYMEDSKP